MTTFREINLQSGLEPEVLGINDVTEPIKK